MKIGIVSDLHRRLPNWVKEALAGCDRILCAGDVERPDVLWELETIAPVTAVAGNNDYGLGLPFTATFTLEGVRFFMVHRPQDIGTPAPDVQMVVHGHTHMPRDEEIGGVRYVNPGSPTRPRGGSEPSVALMTVRAGKAEAIEFVNANS